MSTGLLIVGNGSRDSNANVTDHENSRDLVKIEGSWNPNAIRFPPHEGLARILVNSSLRESFLVEDLTAVEEGWFVVRLKSTGRLQPL